jgi:hypothetical protein
VPGVRGEDARGAERGPGESGGRERLVRMPLTKIYRAFPELDRFTDAQCAAWVRLAQREHWGFMLRVGVVLAVLLIPAAGLLIGIVSSVTGVLAASRFGSWIGRSLRLTIDDVEMIFKGPALIAAMVLVFVVAALVRDRALRHVVQARLRSGRCTACDYTLMGLKPQGSMVRCPECGIELDLNDLGLTPADILAPGEEKRT